MSEDYICQQHLIEDRNWTLTQIKKWLGDPDQLATNPYNPHSRKMKLYSMDRVKAIEHTIEFQMWLDKYLKRKQKNEFRIKR